MGVCFPHRGEDPGCGGLGFGREYDEAGFIAGDGREVFAPHKELTFFIGAV